MPTPVKYGSEEMKNVYKDVEKLAGNRLLDMLPQEFRDEYSPLFNKRMKIKSFGKL